MRRKCLKWLSRQLTPPPPLHFVQGTNKMKTILAKPHPSVGKEDPPRKKVIPKDLGQSKRKGKDYEVDDYTEGSMQKGKIILFEGG